jgi:hypothetical protein
MQWHILNCFEITNADALKADYRLVDVEGPFDPQMADGELAERNREQLLKRIAYEERIPVAYVGGGRQPIIAVPAGHELRTLEYHLAPDVATLHPRGRKETLCLGKLTDQTQRIGFAFLGWHLRSPLRADGRLWSTGPWTYFSRRPINYRDDHRRLDVFGGFGLRVGLRNGKPCVWVKLTHRYVESAWMLDAYESEGIREELRMRHLLYHYGHQWFSAQLLGLTGKSIAQQRFVPDGEREPISVYDYTTREVGGRKAPGWIASLNANSPAIEFRYSNDEKKRYGAASLCKLMLRTGDSAVSGLHRLSIKSPQRRFEQLASIVNLFLQNGSFDGEPIKLSSAPVRVQRRVFDVPAQEFGQGQTIHVGHDAAVGETRLQDLGRKRLELLLDPQGGVAVRSLLDAQYLLAPQSQPRAIVEDFQKRLEQTVRSILQRNFRFSCITYADRDARTLKQQAEAIIGAIDRAGVTSGRGVLMLPAAAKMDLHNFIKKKLQDRMQFQCVASEKLAEFYALKPRDGKAVYDVRDGLGNRYVSYRRCTAMGLLLVNRQWPWVLEKETYYDLYVGVDVLHNTAAFTFFADGGRECFLYSVTSRKKEKLSRSQVRSVIYEQLKEHLKRTGRVPRSVVMRRDGRCYGSERAGFRDAINQLISEGLLPSDVLFGVIDVHKTSAEGFRLVEILSDGRVRNPMIGSWEEIHADEGIVCTTGFPFRFQGTVKPLVVRIVAGDLKLEPVLEDTFAMSQLCWPVPDRCMRLSIDLKLCDDHLRSIAAQSDDDEGQFGDDEDERSEQAPVAAGWSA